MQLQTYTITIIIGLLSSTGLGMMMTVLFNRRKTKSETLLAQAQTQLTGIETYSVMLGDLRNQINMQGDQIKNQAEQILHLQAKEINYIKVIDDASKRERRLQSEIRELKTTIKQMEIKINNLQNIAS